MERIANTILKKMYDRMEINGKIYDLVPVESTSSMLNAKRIEIKLVDQVYKFRNPHSGCWCYVTTAPSLEGFVCFEYSDGYRDSKFAAIHNNNRPECKTTVAKYVIFS